MRDKYFQKVWSTICSECSVRIPNGNVLEGEKKKYQQSILKILEKLGWSDVSRQIDLFPKKPDVSSNHINPFAIINGHDTKTIIATEIRNHHRIAVTKLQGESNESFRSYMINMNANFGLLFGKGIKIYYRGVLNHSYEPEKISHVTFDKNSDEGIIFVALFNRRDFIKKFNILYLKDLLDKNIKLRNLKVLKKCIISEHTKKLIKNYIKHEYSDFDSETVAEALRGLRIQLDYRNYE